MDYLLFFLILVKFVFIYKLVLDLTHTYFRCICKLLFIRFKERIDRNLKGLVEKLWYYPLKQNAGLRLEARVRIAFNQGELEVRVKHKVETHKLKAIVVCPNFANEFGTRCLKNFLDALLNLGQNDLGEIYIFIFKY